VIVRMWETRVKPGQTDRLLQYVTTEVWPTLEGARGFLGGEVLRSHRAHEDRVLLATRWEDESALETYLGAAWAAHDMTPVPAEEPYLEGTPFVDHWVVVPVD
jgi:heme-degrading monooxygenase HmoA